MKVGLGYTEQGASMVEVTSLHVLTKRMENPLCRVHYSTGWLESNVILVNFISLSWDNAQCGEEGSLATSERSVLSSRRGIDASY